MPRSIIAKITPLPLTPYLAAIAADPVSEATSGSARAGEPAAAQSAVSVTAVRAMTTRRPLIMTPR